MNALELIKSGNINHIKNYEDTIQKTFSSSKYEVSLIKDPFVNLIELNINICPNLQLFTLDELFINNDYINNIVITGSLIRNSIINGLNSENVKSDLYIYVFGNVKLDLVFDLTKYTKTNSCFELFTNNKTYILSQLIHISPAHILMKHDYTKRVGLINKKYYASSMFIMKYKEYSSSVTIKDPVFNIIYDPFNLYNLPVKDTSIFTIIDKINIDDLNDEILLKIHNNKTCIEYCIDKYINEDNVILKMKLKQMIIVMNSKKCIRPAYLYASYKKLYDIDIELYKILTDKKIIINSINEINLYMFEYLIKTNDINELMRYLININKKIDKEIVNLIIK